MKTMKELPFPCEEFNPNKGYMDQTSIYYTLTDDVLVWNEFIETEIEERIAEKGETVLLFRSPSTKKCFIYLDYKVIGAFQQ
jgi:hypothetical protein